MEKTWKIEPNQINFEIGPYKCEIRRSQTMGYLRGYIYLTKNHPWYGIDYSQLWGITIHNNISLSMQKGQYWVLGFECGKSEDVSPKLFPSICYDTINHHKTYKDCGFVMNELIKLAYQADQKWREQNA